MIKERNREKLLNALIYFSENVHHLGKTKTFKLLNYLDFLHFEKTGRSVTGLKYYAWEMGPVPRELFAEWDHPSTDFNKHLKIETVKFGNGKTLQRLVARKPFNGSWFSPFQLELMENLAKRHFNHTAEEMIEAIHFETGPWHEIWEVKGQKKAEIPYDFVLLRRGNEKDMEILDIAKEYEEIKKNSQMNAPLPGYIYFDKEFIFRDGEKGEKLFVVLCPSPLDKDFVLVARTTTKVKSHLTYGCHFRSKFEAVFFMPQGNCDLTDPTWILFDYLVEYESVVLKRWKRIGELTVEQTKHILNCGSQSYTMDAWQRDAIREYGDLL